MDGHVLHRPDLARAAGDLGLQEGILVAQEIPCRLQLQVGLDPRQHDGRADRLGDVVHSAKFEAQALVVGFGPGGQEHDGNVARVRVGLQPATDLIAVHLRHHDIEQDQVGGRPGCGDTQGTRPTGGHFDAVKVAQQRAQQCDVVRRVVDHEDRGTADMFFRSRKHAHTPAIGSGQFDGMRPGRILQTVKRGFEVIDVNGRGHRGDGPTPQCPFQAATFSPQQFGGFAVIVG